MKDEHIRKNIKYGRCYCGKYEDICEFEPFICNNIQHEMFGIEGHFCGPLWKHEVRDLKKEHEITLKTLLICLNTEESQPQQRIENAVQFIKKRLSDKQNETI